MSGISTNLQKRYVLVTAAHNEEFYLEKVLHAVTQQSLRPLRWVIVNDGSTDGTERIVRAYAARFPFIGLVTLPGEHERNFAAQVHAIQAGYEELRSLDFQFIGNLDSDVALPSEYFVEILDRFDQDPRLGLAGGWVCEPKNGTFAPRRTNRVGSVAHGVQMFRRECFEAIGGYLPLRYGGPDFYAEVQARMKGWTVRSFPELTVQHFRTAGTANGWVRDRIRQGRMDFSIGSHPIFEIAKCLRRITEPPKILGSLVRLSSFLGSYCHLEQRQVSDEFVQFLRKEQLGRLAAGFRLLLPRVGKR